jgi:hypothetical protein
MNTTTPLISNQNGPNAGFAYADDRDERKVPAKIGSVMSHSPLIAPKPTTIHAFINRYPMSADVLPVRLYHVKRLAETTSRNVPRTRALAPSV